LDTQPLRARRVGLVPAAKADISPPKNVQSISTKHGSVNLDEKTVFD
jgi:hypothetical protein